MVSGESGMEGTKTDGAVLKRAGRSLVEEIVGLCLGGWRWRRGVVENAALEVVEEEGDKLEGKEDRRQKELERGKVELFGREETGREKETEDGALETGQVDETEDATAVE